MKKNNNKGAAMASVLIATVFIAVLATTLLYMAYLNYLTKAVRNASNDNFYTCEYALDDLATTLQQIAAETNSPADAIKAMSKACTGTESSSSGAYDNDLVAGLIDNAGQLATISVNSTVSGNNFIVSGNSVTLKGLVITSTSLKEADPYESNISTDLTINFNISSDGGMDVNDFSIITDDTVNRSNGGVTVMSGNIFIRSPKWIEEHVTRDANGIGTLDNYADSDDDYSEDSGARNAVVCGSIDPSYTGNGDILTFTGERGLIVGNVVVGKGSTLTITGQVNVIGNIYVIGGTLMCTNNLKCSGKVHVSNGGVIKGVSNPASLQNSGMNVSFLIDIGPKKAGNGVVSNLYSDFYLVYPTAEKSNYVLAPFTADLETKVHENEGDADVCSKGYDYPSSMGYFMHTLTFSANNMSSTTGVIDSTGTALNVDVQFSMNGGGFNGFSKPTLFFNVYESVLWTEKSLGDTTMLSLTSFGNKGSYQNGTKVGHMSDDDYAAAKKMLFVSAQTQSDYFKRLLDVKYVTGSQQGHSCTGDNLVPYNYSGSSSFASGNMYAAGGMMDIVDDWNDGHYAANGSDGVFVSSYVVGDYSQETRYAVYANGKMYLPYEYLIRPDAGEFITAVFNSISSDMSPTNTNVTYANWQKF